MAMRFPGFGALSIAVFSVAGHVQVGHAQVGAPSLDAISVNPNTGGGGMMGLSYRADGLRITNGSIHGLLMTAYGMNEDQIIGEPAWAKTERFDIEGRATERGPGGLPATPDQRPLMLQQVLVERFRLAAHRDTRELPVYVLSIAKGGAKLRQSDPTDQTADKPRKPSVMAGEDRIDAHDTPMSLLVSMLSRQLNRKIIDKTELAGNYEIKMSWTPDQFTARPGAPADGTTIPPVPDAGSGPSIFTAIEEQLGLKLTSAKGPVDVLVIDRVEKPSEN